MSQRIAVNFAKLPGCCGRPIKGVVVIAQASNYADKDARVEILTWR
jgi:hypothetical protein